MLTRTSYIGVHEFNRRSKHGANKPDDQVIDVEVPRLIEQETWDSGAEAVARPQSEGRAAAGGRRADAADRHLLLRRLRGAMTIRTGKSGRYRHDTCSIAARQGKTGCKGRSIPMAKLDGVVASHLEDRLLDPERLHDVLGAPLDRREDKVARKRAHATELKKRAAEADGRLKRLYDAIEAGVADLGDESLKVRIAELRAIKSQALTDAERAAVAADAIGFDITPANLASFAATARRKLRGPRRWFSA